MRGFFLTILLGVAIAGGVAYFAGLLPVRTAENGGGPRPEESHKPRPDLGEPLYPPAPDVEGDMARPGADPRPDPVIVPARLNILEKQEVTTKRDGDVLFVGKYLKRENPLAPGENESVPVMVGDKELLIPYQPWYESNVVQPDEVVAMLNPAMVLEDIEMKKAKLAVARQEALAADKTSQEAQIQSDTAKRISSVNSSALTAEDLRLKILTAERTKIDAQAKAEQVKLAESELKMSQMVYEEHVVRNKLTGPAMVRYIFKRRGSMVKAMEPIMLLERIDKLRAEGRIPAQYLGWLLENRGKLDVTVEPLHEQGPYRKLQGPRDEVTSVAVSGDPKAPLIVAGSKDQTLSVWTLDDHMPFRVYTLPGEVLAVACSPKESGRNWAACGCADGSVRLFDLDRTADDPDCYEPVWVKNVHRDSVTTLAFSPDGRFLASGSEDHRIGVLAAATGEVQYVIGRDTAEDAHEGVVTSLAFTPQGRLVSAARDNTLRVWDLYAKGASLARPPITGRGGQVTQLGVCAQGRWMLFDKGRTLQLLSVPTGRTLNILENPNAATSFDTLALFSADADLMLTAGAPEGRLQLWRTPKDGKRGFEVRQLVTSSRSPVTCAAFAEQGARLEPGQPESFAVSGCKNGHVYVWRMPTREAVESQLIKGLELSMVDEVLEAGQQVRIAVLVPNRVGEQGRGGPVLPPGGTVNIVIEEKE